MKIVLIPKPGTNEFLYVRLDDGYEYLYEELIVPALNNLHANDSVFKAPTVQFSDFSFGWAILASFVASLVATAANHQGSNKNYGNAAAMTALPGFYKIQQYLRDNKFLYCNDDCQTSNSWRVWINDQGIVEIASRNYAKTGEGGTAGNTRFDCYQLPEQLLTLIPCQKTIDRGREWQKQGSPSGGSSTFPTASSLSSDWWKYGLIGGMGLLLFISAAKGSKDDLSA